MTDIWTKVAAAIAAARAKNAAHRIFKPVRQAVARARLRRNIRSATSQSKDRCRNIWFIS